jgi:hypothetical protein
MGLVADGTAGDGDHRVDQRPGMAHGGDQATEVL